MAAQIKLNCRACQKETTAIDIYALSHGDEVACNDCSASFLFCAACQKNKAKRIFHLRAAFKNTHRNAAHSFLGTQKHSNRNESTGKFKKARVVRSASRLLLHSPRPDWTWGRFQASGTRGLLFHGFPMVATFDPARTHVDDYLNLEKKVAALHLPLVTPPSEFKEWRLYGPIDTKDAVTLAGCDSEALGGCLSSLGLRILPSSTPVDTVYLSNPDVGYQGHVHADKQDFVMLVLTGYKTAYVAPPAPVAASDFSGLSFSFSSNGYEYVVTSQGELVNYEVDRMALANDPWRRITLGAGEALHLPRGWMHCVDSASRTISLSLVAKGST
jgi:hypothetical protein